MGSSEEASPDARLQPILDYISKSWDTLTRTTEDCAAVSDPKLIACSVVYLPAGYPSAPHLEEMARRCNVRILHLPGQIKGPGEKGLHGEIDPPGLLHLENPYVVPGGRFNEMYGWDSYFIIRGLLREGKIRLARGMVENFFFEIDRYGAVLNANRTYYLTRSQQPFLSSMVLAVYQAQKASPEVDAADNAAWLRKSATYLIKDYEMWTREPHLAGATGLSRYYDFGEGPVPEGLHDESGYYRDVIDFLVSQDKASPYLTRRMHSPVRDCSQLTAEVSLAAEDRPDPGQDFDLSREAFKGDRSMRESGFDISFRFGPFSLATDQYAALCLNSLLFKTEQDIAEISRMLGDEDSAGLWDRRAVSRRQTMAHFMWDAERGLFFDFNACTNERSTYEYATTFYPLWAGLATPGQAAAVAANLAVFEQEGGLAMSRFESGAQWDYPYGWAPIHLLAIEGLRRYGFEEEANRISYKFLMMICKNFRQEGTIREKYNVVTDTSWTQVKEGYHVNVIGFGWTNAVFLELLRALPAAWVHRLAAE